ncbi:uncharacterized protein DFL_002289 [Arthrobotrys flagrans]|uniref:Uncharacterized protein n=1 Tax=Arthrobotrys flagrans TaxID=97331 RepID=A0A437AAE0_ARTFL|nr:hypothetical protein DFL_002289 [Arthrobotrys flagrans]
MQLHAKVAQAINEINPHYEKELISTSKSRRLFIHKKPRWPADMALGLMADTQFTSTLPDLCTESSRQD